MARIEANTNTRTSLNVRPSAGGHIGNFGIAADAFGSFARVAEGMQQMEENNRRIKESRINAKYTQLANALNGLENSTFKAMGLIQRYDNIQEKKQMDEANRRLTALSNWVNSDPEYLGLKQGGTRFNTETGQYEGVVSRTSNAINFQMEKLLSRGVSFAEDGATLYSEKEERLSDKAAEYFKQQASKIIASENSRALAQDKENIKVNRAIDMKVKANSYMIAAANPNLTEEESHLASAKASMAQAVYTYRDRLEPDVAEALFNNPDGFSEDNLLLAQVVESHPEIKMAYEENMDVQNIRLLGSKIDTLLDDDNMLPDAFNEAIGKFRDEYLERDEGSMFTIKGRDDVDKMLKNAIQLKRQRIGVVVADKTRTLSDFTSKCTFDGYSQATDLENAKMVADLRRYSPTAALKAQNDYNTGKDVWYAQGHLEEFKGGSLWSEDAVKKFETLPEGAQIVVRRRMDEEAREAQRLGDLEATRLREREASLKINEAQVSAIVMDETLTMNEKAKQINQLYSWGRVAPEHYDKAIRQLKNNFKPPLGNEGIARIMESAGILGVRKVFKYNESGRLVPDFNKEKGTVRYNPRGILNEKEFIASEVAGVYNFICGEVFRLTAEGKLTDEQINQEVAKKVQDFFNTEEGRAETMERMLEMTDNAYTAGIRNFMGLGIQ